MIRTYSIDTPRNSFTSWRGALGVRDGLTLTSQSCHKVFFGALRWTYDRRDSAVIRSHKKDRDEIANC